MVPATFLRALKLQPAVGGDGIRVRRPIPMAGGFIPSAYAGGYKTQNIDVMSGMRTAGGLTLTATTAPTVAAIETNAVGIVVAAAQTACGSFLWEVPFDYDRAVDVVYIDVLCNSAGATDTPTIDATIYNKVAGAALSADLNPTASAAIPGSASPTDDAAIRTVTVTGKGLIAGNVLTVNLVTGGTRGTTDAIQIFGVSVRYPSTEKTTAVETSGLGTILDANTTTFGSFNFTLPPDFDSTAAEFKINILAASAGDTDTPALDAAIYKKRAGAALSADLNPTASAAIPNNTAKAAVRTIDLAGADLDAGDVLTVVLSTGAHTTDNVVIHGIEVQYKSVMVFEDSAAR